MGQATAGNRAHDFTRVAGSSEISGLVCRVRAVLVATLALGAALVALGVPAASATTWNLPATDLSASGRNADAPQVAVAPDGATTVVWSSFDGSNNVIQARTRPAGSNTYGAVEELSASGQNAEFPQVAVAPDGATTVVWSSFDGSRDIIQARTRPAGTSTYGPAEDLSAADQDVSSPQVAVAADGATTVVWSRYDGSRYIAQTRTRAAGTSTYGATEDLSATGEDVLNPQVAVAADGATTVVWSRYDGSHYIIQARTRPAGTSTYETVENLSAAGQGAASPGVAVAADGTTTVVWSRSNGNHDVIQTRTRPAGSNTFAAAQDLSAAGQDSVSPEVAVAPNGMTAVVWQQFDLATASLVVAAAARPAGASSFGAVQDVSQGDVQSSPRVAVAPDGAITVVAEREDENGNLTIQTATRAAGASAFGAVQNLSMDPAAPSVSNVAVAPDGATTAVWQGSDGANWIIRAASSAPTTYPLLVDRSGEGAGSVASTPSGIQCGSTCQARFNLGSTVTLTATAASGSTFTGWSGAGCSGTGSCAVTMAEARSVTATFAGKKPDLRVSIGGPTKVRAGTAFRVGVRVTNRGATAASAATRGRATKAESLTTCLVVPSHLYVVAAQRGATIRGRSVCWNRPSLVAGRWVSYTATLRSSPFFGGSTAIRATAAAQGESGVTASASRSRKIRMTDPRPAARPTRPTG
jgi:hypothetical protein